MLSISKFLSIFSLYYYFIYFRRNFFLLGIISIALVHACYAKLSVECVVDFLKDRSVDDDFFASIGDFSGDASTCTNEVKSKISEFYMNARAKMEANFLQKPYTECVMKDVQGELYENMLLKATAIGLKGVGWKFWKTGQKNSRIQDLENKAQEMVNSALIKCKGQSDYGGFFDNYYEQKRSEVFNDDFDYCMRKHLVDKNVMNPNLYNFNVNPKNLRIDAAKCDEIMKIAHEQMKQQIASGGQTCVINTFIDNGYLDLILKIQLLTKLNITPEERQAEKQVFTQQMINMTHKIRTCPTQN